MAELTTKQKRRGLDFANKVAAIAPAAPDDTSKKAILAAANHLREHYGFKDTDKRDVIKRSLHLGCRTYDDLVRETKFPRADIIRLVMDMKNGGEVDVYTLERNGEGGRPPVYIKPVHEFAGKIPQK